MSEKFFQNLNHFVKDCITMENERKKEQIQAAMESKVDIVEMSQCFVDPLDLECEEERKQVEREVVQMIEDIEKAENEKEAKKKYFDNMAKYEPICPFPPPRPKGDKEYHPYRSAARPHKEMPHRLRQVNFEIYEHNDYPLLSMKVKQDFQTLIARYPSHSSYALGKENTRFIRDIWKNLYWHKEMPGGVTQPVTDEKYVEGVLDEAGNERRACKDMIDEFLK
jgi:hypothetical protein